MSKPVKIALGMATLWPLVYILLFFGFVFYLILLVPLHPNGEVRPPSGMIVIFLLHGLTILWNFVLLTIYICNLFHNNSVDNDKKALWAVVLFLGNMIAMPIYWYLYVWREANPQPQLAERSR
jgi:hypothetical protein